MQSAPLASSTVLVGWSVWAGESRAGVLEVGCGRGVGAQIILERFGAASVDAIDLDPKMIDSARRYLRANGLERVRLSVGNLTCIQAPDATYDAVFDFGAIHLEPDWPKAIAEVRRVLKPGGR